MAKYQFTLTSYEPVYAVAPEVKIPDYIVRQQAERWLAANVCKPGEKPLLTDAWINARVEGIRNLEELLIFVRYNLYKNNREVQQLADQDVICKELATRLVEELPTELVDEALYSSNLRLEDMLMQQGVSKKEFCKKRGITEEQLEADVRERAIESLKEDSALAAWADHRGYTLEAEDFYRIIPGESVQDKAHKRRQIELDGRLPEMEDYALKAKALQEVMDTAMIKRRETDPEYVRYSDVSATVLDASQQHPESFIQM